MISRISQGSSREIISSFYVEVVFHGVSPCEIIGSFYTVSRISQG